MGKHPRGAAEISKLFRASYTAFNTGVTCSTPSANSARDAMADEQREGQCSYVYTACPLEE
jgi:hypothetical protein